MGGRAAGRQLSLAEAASAPVLCLIDIDDQTDDLACPDSLVAGGAKIYAVVWVDDDAGTWSRGEGEAPSSSERWPVMRTGVPGGASSSRRNNAGAAKTVRGDASTGRPICGRVPSTRHDQTSSTKKVK